MSELEPQSVHNNLIEVGLPSSIGDMKNPTSEYIFDLVTQFMNVYGIDSSTIRKPTFEQLSTLNLAEEDPDVLMLINISEATAGICDLIFFKDFNLTDLTSPVPKRTRRIAKFLSNFVLYANNTLSNIEERLENTRARVREINDLIEKKNILTEIRNSKALEVTKKLAEKEQLLAETERTKARKEARKAKIAEISTKLKAIENEKLKAAQRHGKLAAEAIKMRKTTEDLESKVVKSPTRYKASLQELMERKKIQNEKREVMQERIRSQKPAIEKIESYHSMVLREHAKFPEVTEAFKRFTESKKTMEEAKKKVAEMRSVIEREAMMYNREATTENAHATNSALEKVKEQCEQSLSNIRKEHNELSNEKKVLEKKLEDTMTRRQDIYSQTEKIRAASKQRDDEYKTFVKNSQELYDAEIKKVRQVRRLWEENKPCIADEFFQCRN